MRSEIRKLSANALHLASLVKTRGDECACDVQDSRDDAGGRRDKARVLIQERTYGRQIDCAGHVANRHTRKHNRDDNEKRQETRCLVHAKAHQAG